MTDSHHKRISFQPAMRCAVVAALALLVSACGLFRPHTSLTDQVKTASSPADHAALAQAYREHAQRLGAEAAEHAELAVWWASLAAGRAPAPGAAHYEEVEHCRRLAAELSAAAAEAEAMAEFHERLAR
jgi:hypothetical protein